VKLTRDLDQACKRRAANLGMSQSAYIRSLIERHVAEAGPASSDRSGCANS
jgi:predicted DNA binding CopG/RHH family protein